MSVHPSAVYVYICVHARICMLSYARLCVRVHERSCASMPVCAFECMYLLACFCMRACMRAFVHVSGGESVCFYMHAYVGEHR